MRKTAVVRETLRARASEADARAQSVSDPDKQRAYRKLAQSLREMADKLVSADLADLPEKSAHELAVWMLGKRQR